MTEATFYFDLGSPYAYLAAERISEVLPEPVSWLPVSLGGLFKANGRSSWSLASPEQRQAGIAEVERRAAHYGLRPLRWPEPWPTNYLFAMRVATYAQQVGRGQEFAMQAFRNAFQHGQDLAIQEHVLQAASEAGLQPDVLAQASADPQIKLALREATDAAHQLGVVGVPTVSIAGELFWGEDRLKDAANAARRARPSSQ